MNKVGVRVLAAVVAASLIVTPVMAAPSADELKSNKAAKEQEVSSLQQQLTDLMTKLNSLEAQLVEKGEAIAQAEVDLAAAEKKEKKQYKAMKKRIKYMYEEGNATVLETLVSAESFSDLVNKAEYVQNVHDYDRDQLEEYVATKDKITTLKDTLKEEQSKLESMQEEYQAQEEQLAATIESKKAEVADLDQQIQAAAEAAAAEARAREEQERKAAEEAAASQAAQNSQPAASSNTASTANTNTASANTTSYQPAQQTTTVAQGNTAVAQMILNAAYGQLGVPYVWGGTSPGVGLDCSGLTQYCHRVAGISIPRTSGPQGGGGMAVSDPQPGDLVCYGGHVGIYIGGGQMIHAPQPGDVVRIQAVYGSPWYRRYW